VPGDDGGGFHDRQRGAPVGPDRTERDPEGAIDRDQARPAAAAHGDGELLAQGKIVEHQGLSGEGEGPQAPENQFENQEHATRCEIRSAMASDGAQRAALSSRFLAQ